MVKLLRIWLFSALTVWIGLVSSALAGGGDAAARSFADLCQGELPADRQATFYAEMDKTDQAIARGDQAAAANATSAAFIATFRGGSYADDSSIRCLGDQATRRWLNANLASWRRGWSGGLEGRSGQYGVMYVVAADRGTQGLVEVISTGPASDFRGNYMALEEIVELSEIRESFGAPLLPEERAVAAACRDALVPLQEYANGELARVLVAENTAFDRPATRQEQDAMAQMGQFGKFAEAMAGADTGTAYQQALFITERQVRESRELLNQARSLEYGEWSPDEQTPSAARAEERGDILLARANDETRALEFRDDLYTMANGYYAWCKCHDKRRLAVAAKESIQPALAEEQERLSRARAQKSAELEKQAEAMQESIQDMQKTDAEKQSFKEEADALEAELDF